MNEIRNKCSAFNMCNGVSQESMHKVRAVSFVSSTCPWNGKIQFSTNRQWFIDIANANTLRIICQESEPVSGSAVTLCLYETKLQYFFFNNKKELRTEDNLYLPSDCCPTDLNGVMLLFRALGPLSETYRTSTFGVWTVLSPAIEN
jgi:hypothetical protein